MTILHTLASGSGGNAALVERGGAYLLIDAGISCRRITASLRELGVEPRDVSALLLTHTHSDHISGLQTLLKNWDGPVCASEGACADLRRRLAGIENRLRPFAFGRRFQVDGWEVDPFPTSHDAPGSAGFRLDDLGYLTDSGYVSDEAAETLSGAALVVLEANHDVEMLRGGPYPYYLKQRILSDSGHLSNGAAAELAAELAQSGAAEFVLAHLSRDNNTPQRALDAVSAALERSGSSAAVSVAPRDRVSRAYEAAEAVCKR